MSKQGRNDLCSCGSGKKFKRCHGVTSSSDRTGKVLMLVVGGAVIAAAAAVFASFSSDRSASSVRVVVGGNDCYCDLRPASTTANGTAIGEPGRRPC